MRYHLETIPVIDAYKAPSECPLCDLKENVEQSYLVSFLGGSVMEPAVRIEVNQKGFCGIHFSKMIQMKNRLGLALMTHTYLMETVRCFAPADLRKTSFLHKKPKPHETASTCILCDRLSDTMSRYLYTVLHLWRTDNEFQKVFNQSKGHCLVHHDQLLQMAAKEWNAENFSSFSRTLHALQLENMARIEKELKWFTEKFDYRNADKPWGESKDSLERAIFKLRGKQ